MAVEVSWQFNADFKEAFLGIWFEKSPESYTEALEACDKIGNEMIIWLKTGSFGLYEKLYETSLKEKQEAIMARRQS